MANYETVPSTEKADVQATQELGKQQVGKVNQQQFLNELNFWLQSAGPVSHTYLDLTARDDAAAVLAASISGTNAAVQDINQYNPYGSPYATPYAAPYGAYSPYGTYGVAPQPYAPYAAPPPSSTVAPYNYGGTATTTTGSMTTESGSTQSVNKYKTSAKTSGTQSGTVSTTGAAMYTTPVGTAAAPYAASYGGVGGYPTTGGSGNGQLMQQISQIGESQMEMMQFQFLTGQQVVYWTAVSNILKSKHDADMNATRNLRAS